MSFWRSSSRVQMSREFLGFLLFSPLIVVWRKFLLGSFLLAGGENKLVNTCWSKKVLFYFVFIFFQNEIISHNAKNRWIPKFTQREGRLFSIMLFLDTMLPWWEINTRLFYSFRPQILWPETQTFEVFFLCVCVSKCVLLDKEHLSLCFQVKFIRLLFIWCPS